MPGLAMQREGAAAAGSVKPFKSLWWSQILWPFDGNHGVTCSTALPVTIGTIPAGASLVTTLTYKIPDGVLAFGSVVYATASDRCSNSYNYPGPFPGA